tara:strand:- start:271 stop:2811 length:2541 start_codon:yes stop_codon:yes gene_type:complete
MAKYELPQYQSMYKDTGSVQVNQLKRQEYMANMQADNALSTSIMNMEALEEDNETLYTLADKYNGGIDERAQRTDYENLGMTIHRDAMSFVKDYTPIKRSKDLYTAYETMLNKRVASGNITDSIKQRKIAQSKSRYKGIQYTPSGTVDQDSYFSGASVANYVDVNAEFAKAMKDTVAREQGWAGFTLYDKDFNIFLDSEGAKKDGKSGPAVWKLEREGTLTAIPADLVQKISKQVLRRQDVNSYVRQEADLNTYMFNEEEAAEKINESMNILDQKIDRIIESENFTDDEKALQVESIETYKESINNHAQNNGYKSALLHITHDDINDQYLQDAQNKYVYENKTEESDISVLDGDGVGTGGKNEDKPQVYFSTGVDGALTSVVIGGVDTQQIENHLAEQTQIISNTTQEYAGRNVSAEQLLNADSDQEIEELIALMPEDNKVGKETLIGDIKNLRRARDKQTLANIRLDEAKTSVYKDGESEEEYKIRKSKQLAEPVIVPGLKDKLYKDEYQYIPHEDILAGLINVGVLEEGATLYDAFAYLEGQQQKTGEAYVKNTIPANTQKFEVMGHGEFVNRMYGDEGEVDSTVLKHRNIFLGNAVKQFQKAMLEDRKAIETTLKNDTIKFDGLVDTSYGDTTDKTKTVINKAIEKGLTNNIAVITEAGEEPIAYEQYIREKYGEGDVVQIDVTKSGLVNVANPSGVPMIAISLKSKVKKGDDIDIGTTEYIFIPQSEINAYTDGESTIDNYVNSTGFKVNRLYAEGLAHNVNTWSPEIFTVGPEGEESSKVSFKYQNDDGSENSKPIIITSQNDEGIITTTAHGKEAGLKILEGLLDKPINNEGDTYGKYLY